MKKENLQINGEGLEKVVEKIKENVGIEVSIDTIKERVNEKLFRKDLKFLTKEQISSYLKLNDKKIKKNELYEIAVEKIYRNPFLMYRFYDEFKEVFAVTPTEVEEILGCTKTERKRWTQEELLRVLECRKFQQYGQTLEYPVFDRLQIYCITKQNVDGWRAAYQEIKNINKKIAVCKAAETRKINENMRLDFKKEFKKTLAYWYRINGKVGATFELAFWTMWVSRWAKENQEKEYCSSKNYDKYLRQKEYLYELKNNAISLLIKSECTYQSFYQPVNHKKESLELCDNHYDDWKELREGVWMDKWSYFHHNEEEILNCPCCHYDPGNNYYSLFYLEIKHKEIKDYIFRFYTPYSLGVDIFKNNDELPKVEQSENIEGMFRFGRSVFEDEKIIYREKDVIKKFLEVMEKYKLYYPS